MIVDALQESPNHDRLSNLVCLHGPSEVAKRVGTSTRTVERWIKGATSHPSNLAVTLDQAFGFWPARETDLAQSSNSVRFVDLFAGIGGIRTGLENAGGHCVFTSEWDKFAVKTYSSNFENTHQIWGDITALDPTDVPDHDVLAGGFPCQPFSLAGVSKKNSLGRAHGFLDQAQGTLFFNIAAIIAAKQPRAILLENVKNLLSHDGGRTFEVIKRVLHDELGYTVHVRVVDAKRFVPQHRERVIIVGFRDPRPFDWDRIRPMREFPKLDEVLHPEDGSELADSKYLNSDGTVSDRYTLSDRLWAYLQQYAEKHRAAGNGFGFGLADKGSHTRTLSARYYKDGSEILVPRGLGQNPRRLTPRECARLMGFKDSFVIPVSDTQAYKQFGNSVVVPVIESVSREMLRQLAAPTDCRSGNLETVAT